MTTLRASPDTVRFVDGGWWDRLRRVDPRIWDALLAVGAVVLGVLAFALRAQRPDEPPAVLGFALVVVAGSSLAWRRRAPLTVATIVCAAVATAALFGYWPEFVALLWIAVYSAAAYTERDRLVRVLLPVAVLTSIAISVGERWDRGLNWVEILTDLIVTFGIPFLLGRMTFNRRRRIVREREVATREAVAAERAAIARELHDVVAHHMSVMVVQAGAARAVGETDPAATAEALRQIEASGRTGLAEMRRLLEVLKAEADGNGRAPQPGLARLSELLDAMRASGLPVEAVDRRDAAGAVARRRPVGLPHRPGGAHELAPARRRGERARRRALRAGRARARDRRRRVRTARGPRGLRRARADRDARTRPAVRRRARGRAAPRRRVPRPGAPALGAGVSDAPIRVLIADDQALMRTGFRMILDAQDDIEVVGEAIDGADAIRRFEALSPDVVVMDVRMPTMDGIEATRRLSALERPARVLILTTFDLDDYVYEALRAGASGFLLKDRPPEELVAAVRVIAAGEALLAPSVTRRLIEEFARRAPTASRAELDDLTEREREVLVLMARGLSNAEIARTLFVAETTVKTHVGRVLHKLGLRDRAQAVVLAYESGLVQPGD